MASLKTIPGDIFAIPTHNKDGQQGFVLARTIELNGDVAIFEVFEKFYLVLPGDLADVDTGKRLFRPVLGLFIFGKNIIPTEFKWKILFHDSSYHRDQSDYKNIKLAYRPSDGNGFCRIWQDKKEYKIPETDAKSLEEAMWWQPHQISARAAEHLAGLIGAEERYDPWKTAGLEENKENHPKLLEDVHKKFIIAIEDCKAGSEKIKQWNLMRKKSKLKNA